MKFSSLKTSPEKESQGVWMAYGSDLKVRVARTNNAKFREEVQRLSRPHQISLKTGNLDPKVAEDIMKTAASRFILLDWQGLEEDDGSAIPYSSQKARELFDQSQDFFATIMELANNAALFKNDDLGNSSGL